MANARSRLVLEVAIENLSAFDRLAQRVQRSYSVISTAAKALSGQSVLPDFGQVFKQAEKDVLRLGVLVQRVLASPQVANRIQRPFLRMAKQASAALTVMTLGKNARGVRRFEDLEYAAEKAQETILALRAAIEAQPELAPFLQPVIDELLRFQTTSTSTLTSWETLREVITNSSTTFNLLSRAARALGTDVVGLTSIISVLKEVLSLAGTTAMLTGQFLIGFASTVIPLLIGGFSNLIRVIRTGIQWTLRLASAFARGLVSAIRVLLTPLERLAQKLKSIFTGGKHELGFGTFMRRFMLMRSVLMGLQITVNLLSTNLHGLLFSLMFLNYGVAKVAVGVAALTTSMGLAVRAIRNYGDEVERSTNSLINLFNSVEQGQRAFAVLQQWAVELGRPLSEVQAAAAELARNGLLNAEMLKAAAVLAAATGDSMDATAKLLTQAIGLDKPNLEVLRKVGIYMNEAAISTDRLTAAKQVALAISERYSRALELEHKSAENAVNRIKVALSSTFRTIVKPFHDLFYSPFVQWLADIARQAYYTAVAFMKTKEVQLALRSLWADFMATIREFNPEIKSLREFLVSLVRRAFLWLIGSLRIANVLIRLFFILWRQVGRIMGWLGQRFKSLVDHIRMLANAVKTYLLTGNTEPLKQFFMQLWSQFKEAHPLLAEAFENLWNSLKGLVDEVRQRAKEFGHNFVQGFLDGLLGENRQTLESGFAGFVNSLASGINSLTEFLNRNQEDIAKWGQKLGFLAGSGLRLLIDMLIKLGTWLTDPKHQNLFGMLADSFDDFANRVSRYWREVDLGRKLQPGETPDANVFNPFRLLEEGWNKFKAILPDIIGGIHSVFDAISTIFSKRDAAGSILDTLLQLFVTVRTEVNNFFATLNQYDFQAPSKMFGLLSMVLGDTASAITGPKGVGPALANLIILGDKIASVLIDATAATYNLFSAMFELGKAVYDIASGAFKVLLSAVRVLLRLFEFSRKSSTETTQAYLGAFGDLGNKIIEFTGSIISAVFRMVRSVAFGFRALSTIFTGVDSSTTKGLTNFINWLDKLQDKVNEGLNQSIMPESTSFEGAFTSLGQGIASGITTGIASYFASKDTITALTSVGYDIINYITSGVSEIFNPDKVAELLINPIVAFLDNSMDTLTSIGSRIAEGLKSGILAAFTGFWSGLFSTIPVPSLPFSKHASGFEGVVNRPRLMLVGEAGPEYVSITPLNRATPAGGGTVNITINVNGAADPRLVADEVQRRLERAFYARRPMAAMI